MRRSRISIDDTLDERKALASRIKSASQNTGFFYIRNHGIPEELIQNSVSQAKTTFDQPLSEKMKIYFSASNVSSGYHGVGSMQANPRKMVRTFTLALGEREEYFDDVTSHPGADALCIHYPGIPDVAADSDIDVGIGSHTDIQCFTLLWKDNSGGLQVLSAQDEWIDSRPIEGTLVVNIGDFLQRISNNKFKSTVHRVYNRQPDSRYSMPFFFGFNPEAVCKVVPSCVDDEYPPLYEPISCGESVIFCGPTNSIAIVLDL
ncbi:hypothetical protein BDV41DRAFT_561769 [Aspergillus transmontanensis]|uniref:Fe2OG dioxygenase domain-containing protein n=1 Tax=Aspergillus transmontanensis TaxID=1034304 RepID=A0A5N6W958_9EURO|nr:hypothetical protein BDV41DRAFT_561769 [Aspergillus transmontanensis]